MDCDHADDVMRVGSEKTFERIANSRNVFTSLGKLRSAATMKYQGRVLGVNGVLTMLIVPASRSLRIRSRSRIETPTPSRMQRMIAEAEPIVRVTGLIS